MNRIPSLQELCLNELDARYIDPRWPTTLGSHESDYCGHLYPRLNPPSNEEDNSVLERIESACSHVLQKMYGGASGLGPAVFSRNATQQFFHLRKRANIYFQEMSEENVPDRIQALIVSLFQRQAYVSIQEKLRIVSRFDALLSLLAQSVPEEIFAQFCLKKQEVFYPSLFSYILNGNEGDRFKLARRYVLNAALCGGYEAFEPGVSAMQELYTFEEPIAFTLNRSVEKALWKQDLAVVVRLIQLGANVTANCYTMSERYAICLGKPELASRRYNVCELASYLYPNEPDEPEEPIVSFIKEEHARQKAAQPPPCKRRALVSSSKSF